MKRLIFFCLLFVISFTNAQVKKDKGHSFSPKVGETISVTYDQSKLMNLNQLTCEVLIDRGTLDPLLLETPLKKEGDKWQGSFVIADTASRLIVYRYVSGEQKDDNEGNPMNLIVYAKNNKPVIGSHVALGNFYLTGRFWDFKRSANLKEAKKEFEAEKKYYPSSCKAAMGLWEVTLKEDNSIDIKNKIKKDLEKFYTKNKTDEDAIASVISLYERLDDSSMANKIRKETIFKNPKGKLAQQMQSADIRKEKDNQKRIELINKFLDDFPEMETSLRRSYTQNLIRVLIQAKEFDKADNMLSKLDKPDAGFYNSISWPLIDIGDQLDRALGWTKKGIEIARNQTIADKPSSMKIKDWDENNKYTLAMILDTYGTGLMKQEKYVEALTAFEETFKISEAAGAEMNTHYIEALFKNNNYEKSIEVGIECVKKGKDSPELITQVKEAFARSIGPKNVFDSLSVNDKKKYETIMADAQKIKMEELRKKLRESRISKSPTDFTLKDLNVVPVTLSSLKGKVVIVDFWATWCGPCKMSFPYLQKVSEKYRTNESVKFLAVNTWERQKDYDAQLANAKKFIEDNKYTFTVLLDEKTGEQYNVVSDYEVEGIPTKFIIDKKGNIAFKSVGFDGPGMEDELTEQIEMLLAE